MSQKSRKKKRKNVNTQQQLNPIVQIPKRVEIVDTLYTKETNLVEWKVVFEDKRELILAIDGDELGYMLGFDIIFTPELIEKACQEFKGKTKLLLFNKDNDVDNVDLKKIPDSQLDNITKEINKYPVRQIVETLHNSAVRKTKEDLTLELNNRLDSMGISVQLVKKSSKTENLVDEFWFGGVWQSKKKLDNTDLDNLFRTISKMAIKYGLIAEKLLDFASGFFIIRAIK